VTVSEVGVAAFEVRPARPRDARSFLHLYRVVIAEERFIRTEDLGTNDRAARRRFRMPPNDSSANLVAVAGDAVIGSLGISREDQPVTRHVASLGMMVAPGWRRRGVGSALMREAIAWAKRVGVEKLELSVYPDNAAAIALYRSFAFEEEGRLRGHSKKRAGYVDEILMGLWLAGPRDTGDLLHHGDGARPELPGGRQ
jgi:RimJ/RimL family protein N-acetyltransferase